MTRILLYLLYIFTLPIFGQTYKTLLDNVNEWQFTTCYFGCFTDVYYTDGDTIVDGKTHKILDGYHYISRTFLLREEVNDKKIYLTKVSPDRIDVYLLYDFSLTEGDTIEMLNPITPFPPEGGYFMLDSIRYRALVDENEYAHYYFSPTATNTISTDNAIWIEGVGSLSIINAPGGLPDINGAGHLSCFFKDGEGFYTNLDSIKGCEPIHLGLLKPQDGLENIIVYTPSQSQQCILKNTQKVKSLAVYTLQGKKIVDFKNTEQQDSITLDVSQFKSGLYMLVAESFENTRKTFKVAIK